MILELKMVKSFIFKPVHEINLDEYESIVNQTMLILNSEWPRSDTIRLLYTNNSYLSCVHFIFTVDFYSLPLLNFMNVKVSHFTRNITSTLCA